MGLESNSTIAARLTAAPPAWQAATTATTVRGLVPPGPPYVRGVGTYQPTQPPALTRRSFTASPSGGAPGATFGPPGVAGAPVPVISGAGITIGGLTLTPGLLLLVGVIAVGGYLVLR